MAIVWEVPPEQALEQLTSAYVVAIRRAIYQLAQRYAVEIEAWIKANAPWTDRTSNARQTLSAEAEKIVDTARIVIAHGMEYGIFLELAHGGAWAIIGPALDHFAPLIWQDVLRVLGK